MELEEGSLRDVLRWKYSRGFNEPEEPVIARILFETLKGLEFLHDLRMIHRDIKAGNILFDSEACIKLADFGVSAIVAEQDSLRTTMAGTWHWMAPEVINHTGIGGYDSQVDIWSLGVTAIELAYGDAPYGEAPPMQVVVFTCSHEPPTLNLPKTPNFKEPKKFSSVFQDFVSCCLRREPQKRHNTKKLLQHKFVNAVSKDRSPAVKKALLDQLPNAGARWQKETELRKQQAVLAHEKQEKVNSNNRPPQKQPSVSTKPLNQSGHNNPRPPSNLASSQPAAALNPGSKSKPSNNFVVSSPNPTKAQTNFTPLELPTQKQQTKSWEGALSEDDEILDI